jgi:hypothetical protein
MTNEEVVEKLARKEWRMKNLYAITTKEGGNTVKFRPNTAQEIIFEALKTHHKIIVLKARQLGSTTGVSIWFLDEVLFHRNINALSVMQTQAHAIAAFDNKVQFAWKNMDKELKEILGWKLNTERANQLKFEFPDGASSSYAVAQSGRSGTFQYVHISELASLCAERPLDAKEVITGTLPTIPADGYSVIESTAEGETGYFADYWRNAVEGKNGYHPIFLSWRHDITEIEKTPVIHIGDMPSEFLSLSEKHHFTPKELSYYYSKWKLMNCDWAELRQEYPTTPEEAFMSSTEKLFDTEAVDDYLTRAEEGKASGGTTIFSQPRQGRTYVIGSDPSEGVGQDHSTAVVWEVDGSRPAVVATFASNKIPPEDLAYVLKELSVLYNGASIAVERNNHGHAVIAVLRRIYDEEKLYRSSDTSSVKQGEGTRYGFQTNVATKPLILHELASAIRERIVAVPSRPLLTEMRVMPRQESQRIRSDETTTRHFDLLIASAIGFHARTFAMARSNMATQGRTHVQTTESDVYSAI